MKDYKKIVENIAKQIERKLPEKPICAIILGSGLGWIAEKVEKPVIIDYKNLKNMPKTEVVGHKNRFIFGYIHKKPVILMQGRFHAYSGFTAKEVVLPIYIFKLLGCKNLILTNSAGGVNKNFNPGDIMIIKDHINLTGLNPLVDGAIIDFGEQFIDMSCAYDSTLRKTLKNIANKKEISLQEGVYLQMLGPSYETPAEVKMAQKIGADAVGMSTALEVISARQCGLKVLGLSLISNMASGLTKSTLNHKEVLGTAKKSGEKLGELIFEFIKKLN